MSYTATISTPEIRLRVRVHDRQILEARSGSDQQTVVHGELHFPDDRQLVLDEQVVVPMDASPDRVLHRQDPSGRASLGHRREHVLKAAARHHRGLRRKPQRRRFAVGSRLPLERDTHVVAPMVVSAFAYIHERRLRGQDSNLRMA